MPDGLAGPQRQGLPLDRRQESRPQDRVHEDPGPRSGIPDQVGFRRAGRIYPGPPRPPSGPNGGLKVRVTRLPAISCPPFIYPRGGSGCSPAEWRDSDR
jgi:hypothetical protein